MVKQAAAEQQFVPQTSPFSPTREKKKRVIEMLYKRETNESMFSKNKIRNMLQLATQSNMETGHNRGRSSMQLVDRITVYGFAKINS